MFGYLQYLSVLFLILFAIIIHEYEDKYPLENFKRLKTFKFDMLSIMISTLFVLFILDFLLNENIISLINNIFGLGESISEWPSYICLIMALIVGDFGYYLTHRFLHLSQMWNAHQFHHSTINIYWFSGLRTSFINSLLIRIPYLIGFQMFEISYEIVSAAGIFLLVINFWIHSNLNLKYDKFLSHIFITPNFHRLHHVNDKQVAGCNFGNIFSVWDHIFGTALISDDWQKSPKGEYISWKKFPRRIIGF